MKGYFLEEMMFLSKIFFKILFLELFVIIIIKYYEEIVSLIVYSIGDIEKLFILLDIR